MTGVFHQDSDFVNRKIKIRNGFRFEARAKFNKNGKFTGWDTFLNKEPVLFIDQKELFDPYSADEAIEKIKQTLKEKK